MKRETPFQIAERIARHHLDSERVSVTQFSDIVTAIEAAIVKRDEVAQDALANLKSEHVLPNLFRLGALGKEDVERAIKTLESIRGKD